MGLKLEDQWKMPESFVQSLVNRQEVKKGEPFCPQDARKAKMISYNELARPSSRSAGEYEAKGVEG